MTVRNFSYCSCTMLLALLLVSGCTSDNQDAQIADEATMQMAPAIELVTVDTQPFTNSVVLPGRIVAQRVAEVRARVAGIVLKRHFVEGSLVSPEQALFSIEPASYQAALAKAKASTAKAKANLQQMQAEVNRAKPLIKVKAISPQEYDTAIANLKAAQASLLSAQAEVKNAEINLSYTKVQAPITGRIGAAQVTEGALVGQGEATAMATIRQLDPIYADFTQPVSEYLKMKESINDNGKISITMNQLGTSLEGKFLFSEAHVDRLTGQVTLRGEFPNPDGVLIPDMFVRVSVELDTNPQSVFIPQRAVLRNPDGSAKVMIVAEEGTAQVQPITTGKMVDGRWQILDGLQGGETIVATNADKIAPGMQLQLPPSPSSPKISAPAETEPTSIAQL